MAKELSYKKSTTIALKACGIVDIANGTIEIDGEEKKILDLLAHFDGAYAEISAKIKEDNDLELPDASTESGE